MDLSIIIVSWNVKDLLKKCLDSIYRQTQGITFEVFVIDNNSNDGTKEFLVGYRTENFTVILNNENQGFAKANNQAIKQAKGEFILLLNPDTEILDNALTKIVEFMRARPDYGVAGCKLLNSDKTLQPSVRQFPTLWSQILILYKLHRLWQTKSLKKYFAADFDYSRTQECEQVMGAFFMIRQALIEKIGPLDESFFIWFEEVDFCKRARTAGYKIIYTPEVEIIHHQKQSFGQVLNFKKQRIFNKSLRYYFKKHHGFWPWLVLWLINPNSLFLAWLSQILKRSSSPRIKMCGAGSGLRH